MPAIKEKWEIAFEEYRDTLLSLGVNIKKESALRAAYKIYRERIPERIYNTCVEEKAPAQKAPETITPATSETPKRENQAAPDKKEAPQGNNVPSAEGHSHAAPDNKENGRSERRDNRERRNNDQNRDGKPRMTQKERFENYKSNLARKGIVINNETGLFELFRSIRGRLDYSQIGEFVTFPERKPRDNNRDNKDRNRDDHRSEGNNNRDNKERNRNNNRDNRKDKSSPDRTRFEEYRESLLAQGYEIIDQNQFARLYNKQNGFINPEQLKELVRKTPENKRVINKAAVSNSNLPVPAETKLPVIIEGSFADKWIKPLQKWVDTDRDKDGKVKRTVTAVKADNNSVVIDVVPTGKYAEEHQKDAGARYSFTKKNQQGDIESTLGSKDGSPLDYEYFRQLMIGYRKNNIHAIAFKDISTNEFRDKLLAAALEFDMKMTGAPEKIDINAPYLKKLPSAIKIKLGVYNGDLSSTGKPIGDVKKDILKRKENQRNNNSNTPTDNGEQNPPKKQLALPAHLPSREME